MPIWYEDIAPYTSIIQTCHGHGPGTTDGPNAGSNGHVKEETYLRLSQASAGANIMGWMWLYDIKWDGDENKIKDKARLIGKGHTQQLGVDYNETWAGVTRLESVRNFGWLQPCQVDLIVNQLCWSIPEQSDESRHSYEATRRIYWTEISRWCVNICPTAVRWQWLFVYTLE